MLVDSFLKQIEISSQPARVQSSDYKKIPGNYQIFIEVALEKSFAEVINKLGARPVLLTETEAIFDNRKNSDIYLKSFWWLHLEIM